MRIERSRKLSRILSAVAAFLLWVATSIACLAEIWLWGEILLWNLFRFNAELGWLKDGLARVLLKPSGLVVLVLGLGWFAFVIWTGEYHVGRFGQRSSWRRFAWTVGIEAVVGLAYFLLVVLPTSA